MFQGTIQKVGDTFEVVIPDDEVERLGLVEGQMVKLQVKRVDEASTTRPQVAEILDQTSERSARVMKHLKDK